MEVQNNQGLAPEHVVLSPIERAIVNKPDWLERAATVAQQVQADHEDGLKSALSLYKEVRAELRSAKPINMTVDGQTLVFADGPRHVEGPLDNQGQMRLDTLLKIHRGEATYDSDAENRAPTRQMSTESKVDASFTLPGASR